MGYVEYAERFIGMPYIWGGDGSGKAGGFDCSGLVLECLWAFGLYSGKDTTAKGLRTALLADGWVEVPRGLETEGDILFWGKGVSGISHVSIAINDRQHVEAGGGGSKCTSPSNSTGMVRIRPISSRSDLVCALRRPAGK